MNTDFPPEPWDLAGDGWVSAWPVPAATLPALPSGVRPVTLAGRAVVVTAFVDYLPHGLLAYRELLAAVLVRRARRPGLSITHIWVDSVPSRTGARHMWGIPKELADFRFTRGGTFNAAASTADGHIASAAYTPRGPALPALPVRGATLQDLADTLADTPVRARGPLRFATASWQFDGAGPLAWLRGHRPLLSLTTSGFAMRFGPRRAG